MHPIACSMLASVSLTLAAALALVHPQQFFDAGDITATAIPASITEYPPLPFDLFNFGQNETLTVKWIRFNVPQAITGELFLDIDSRITNIDGPQGDLFMALYDNAGNLIITDDTDGSFPETYAAGLSFGSSAFRSPPDTPVLAGQDGATLPAGQYWFALVAGNNGTVTANPTNWDIGTTSSYQLGYFDPGTYYVSLSFQVGNTTPLPPPSNDNCAEALTIGENAGSGTVAWTGTNAGGSFDGYSNCYRRSPYPAQNPKDIWFNYVPSATGFAEVIATAGPDGGVDPILTRYAEGCGSAAVQCSGGAILSFDNQVRLFFPVVEGQPVLLSLAGATGQTGVMELNIRLLPPPCPISIPDGAIFESELACGDSSNDGCFGDIVGFDAIAPGQTVTGRLFNTTTTRDVDWYSFTLPAASVVSATFAAQYPSVVTLVATGTVPGACLSDVVGFVENPDIGRACDQFSTELELAAGTYYVVIAHAYFDGLGCGSGYERYWLRLDATPVSQPCLADIAGAGSTGSEPDGVVDGGDFIAFINSFGIGDPAVDGLADVAGAGANNDDPDGIIDGTDFIAFINAFAAGC